jgi:uncharacterized protein
MSTDHIRYDLLVQDALRSVVKNVLTDACKNGLPGEHHFYVSFKTKAPGVRISNRLREQYPEEMTIVLQHQFWDLGITEHTVEVGLSFGGVPERLLVPFDAIVGFFDPSVQFGLKFEVQEADAVAENDDTKGAKLSSVSSVSPMVPPKAAGGLLKPQDQGQNNQKPGRKGSVKEVAADTAIEKAAVKDLTSLKDATKKGASGVTSRTRDKKLPVAEKEEPDNQPTAAIVSLDAFRKKK